MFTRKLMLLVHTLYDEINSFQRVITLLLNIKITKFKNWSVDNRLTDVTRLNFFEVARAAFYSKY